jgi:hypothetical protein
MIAIRLLSFAANLTLLARIFFVVMAPVKAVGLGGWPDWWSLATLAAAALVIVFGLASIVINAREPRRQFAAAVPIVIGLCVACDFFTGYPVRALFSALGS